MTKKQVGDSSRELALNYRRNRLIQALRVSRIVILVVFAHRLVLGYWAEIPAIIILFIAVHIIYLKAHKSDTNVIAATFMWVTTIILTYFVWTFQGFPNSDNKCTTHG